MSEFDRLVGVNAALSSLQFKAFFGVKPRPGQFNPWFRKHDQNGNNISR